MRLFKIFIFFQLIISTSTHSQASVSCRILLKPNYGTVKQEVRLRSQFDENNAKMLSEELAREVNKITSGHRKITPEVSKSIFESYLNLRLAALPNALQQKIRSIVQKIVHQSIPDSSSDESFAGNEYDHMNKTIYITMPQSYSFSVLDFAVRVHELEHLIQDLSVGESPYHMMHPKSLTVYRFEEERGAMLAEAAFLQALPTRFIQDLLNKVILDVEVNAEIKDFFKSILSSTLEEAEPMNYVKSQWAANRYSRSKMIREQAIITGVMGLPVSFIMGAILHRLLL